MRLTIAYSKIKRRNLVLINNATHQRETLTEWPIRLPLTIAPQCHIMAVISRIRIHHEESTQLSLWNYDTEKKHWKSTVTLKIMGTKDTSNGENLSVFLFFIFYFFSVWLLCPWQQRKIFQYDYQRGSFVNSFQCDFGVFFFSVRRFFNVIFSVIISVNTSKWPLKSWNLQQTSQQIV